MRLKRDYKTLFLDRDGVINVRIVGDYIKKWESFEFNEGVLEAMKIFALKFETIVIVTNQQGISKGLMTEDDLLDIHSKMRLEVEKAGGRIDEIFYCKDLAASNSINRKPNIGMGLQARKKFKTLRFKESIMVGDSGSDMRFGRRLKMKTIYISKSIQKTRKCYRWIDMRYDSLLDFAKTL
ncbi:MAG: histidinol phosphate phosphatase [Bacteroidetes bacterium]|nr:histidinol phosphate phosphatase [Bacteroidota bacterium]